jgi:hypothetical protein
VKHFTVSQFWQRYHQLPPEIQNLADKNYTLLKQNPRHPSLKLKKVGKLWSVRVGQNYRALGVDKAGGILWFWIGPHEAYEKILE